MRKRRCAMHSIWRNRRVILSLLAIALIVAYAGYTIAQERGPANKRITVSTSDPKASYDPLGLVSGRSGSAGENIIENVEKKLAEEGAKLGADAVVVVRFLGHQGYMYGYGTAVKFR